MQLISDMSLENSKMFNAWERAIPSGERIIHNSSHKNRILETIHCIIDSQIHRIGFRIIKDSKFRIPRHPNHQTVKPPKQIQIELTLTQSIWRSIEAISEKRATIESSLSYFDEAEIITRIVSIPNSGRAFQSAMTLYDKQVVLQESLYAGYTPPAGDPSQFVNKKRNPTFVLLKFIIVRMVSKLQVIINRLQKKRVNWTIGICPLADFPPPNLTELRMGDLDRFAADPFLCTVNSETYIFYETIENGKGVIDCAKVTSKGIEELTTILKEPFHLSYPYILKHQNNIYMLPETSEKREIRLYRSTTFPTEWTFDRTLISDVLAADSILLRNENEWHLITNLSSGLVKDFGSELWHFSAQNLNQGEWKPNLHNPISMDARVSRNAGSYKLGSNFFRCNQVPGFSQYGFGVEINIIEKISNSGYEEIKVEKHLSGYHPKDIGCHHLSHSDGMMAYDFSYESGK